VNAPLPHPTECGTHELPRVAPPPVGRVGRYIRDTPHRHRLPVHEDLERQDRRHRPDISVLLDNVDPFGVKARVLLRIVVLLPLLYAPT
jgi:hypothetical protein